MSKQDVQALSVRIPKHLHRMAKLKATLNKTSLNQIVIDAFEHYVNAGHPSAEALNELVKLRGVQDALRRD